MRYLAYEAYLSCFSNSTATKGHLVKLASLASECQRIVEVGVEFVITTFCFLMGVQQGGSVVSIDIARHRPDRLALANRVASESGVSFSFIEGSDLQVDVPSCDMLFIDGLHTYQHVITELRVLQGRVAKYIVLHDTSEPWENVNEPYTGDHKEHPGSDKHKQGVWTAVVDFLQEHPHWRIKERLTHSHGLTILQKM